MRIAHVFALLLAAPALLPSVDAQLPDAERMELSSSIDHGFELLTQLANPAAGLQSSGTFYFRAEDLSLEREEGTLAPGRNYHSITISARILTPNAAAQGWLVGGLKDYFIQGYPNRVGGFVVDGNFSVSVTPAASLLEVDGVLEIALSNRTPAYDIVHRHLWKARLAPLPNARIALPSTQISVTPDDPASFRVQLINDDFYEHSYALRAYFQDAEGVSPERVAIAGGGTFRLGPKETRNVTMSFYAPAEKFWYRDQIAFVTIEATNLDGTGQRTDVLLVTIRGFYVDENLILTTLLFLFALALLIWLFLHAKRAYEKRYLGRPIPPWNIPEERVQLDRIRQEDPRAHYVLRYFLMEQEYRSALLWFHAYKKISRRELKGELRAIHYREKAVEMEQVPAERFEHAFARVERRFARKLDRRNERTDRKVAALQARLERNYMRDFKRDHQKWKKAVENVTAKHDGPHAREHKRWKKEVQKLDMTWDRPFRREKRKADKKLAKAREKYIKLVKKKDKPAWKAWRETHRDWEDDAVVRSRQGLPLFPEPLPQTDAVPPPELPPAFESPPRPAAPPEPKKTPVPASLLSPEPQPVLPKLEESHYARKARRVRAKGARKVRKLERKWAHALEAVNVARRKTTKGFAQQRAAYTEAAETTKAPSFVDRILGRTPERMEIRDQVSRIKSRTRERLEEARERERTRLGLVRAQGERRVAELNAQLLNERAAVERLKNQGSLEDRAQAMIRIRDTEKELHAAIRSTADQRAKEEVASQARLDDLTKELEDEETEALLRLRESKTRPTPAGAEPAKS